MQPIQFFLLLLFSSAPFAATASGGTNLRLIVSETRLPEPLLLHSSVYDGQDSIYVFGGLNSSTRNDRLFKYSLVTGTWDTVGPFLNVSRGRAVLDGDHVFYFGGYPAGPATADVVRVSLLTGEQEVIKSFNSPRVDMSVAWDAEARVAYIFGGMSHFNNTWTVYRYDVGRNRMDFLNTGLPYEAFGGAAVWDPCRKLVYVFGGWGPSADKGKDVLIFDPATLLFTAAMPLPVTYHSPNAMLAAGCNKVYIVGEYVATFDPVTWLVEMMGVENWVHQRVFDTSAVYVPKLDRIYIFGGHARGFDGRSRPTDRIAYLGLGGGVTT